MSRIGLLLTLLGAGSTALANVLLRKGLLASTGAGSRMELLLQIARNEVFLGGVGLYAVAMLLWFRILVTEPVSTAYPVFIGLSFCMVMVGSQLLLGEGMTLRAVLGAVIILVGITVSVTG